MILVDSSGWIEYLAARPKADLFAPYIEGSEPLGASVIRPYEIYEVVRRDLSEERAVAASSCAQWPGIASGYWRMEGESERRRSPTEIVAVPGAVQARCPSSPLRTPTAAVATTPVRAIITRVSGG